MGPPTPAPLAFAWLAWLIEGWSYRRLEVGQELQLQAWALMQPKGMRSLSTVQRFLSYVLLDTQ